MSVIIAVSGYKNSGKTTVIEKLVKVFSAREMKTAVIKHDGHSFEPDMKGTDTRRFYDAGAVGTAVFDGGKFQLVKRCRADEKELTAMFPEADIIMLEGFKHSEYPKLWVCSDEKPKDDESIKNIIAWIGRDGQPCFDKDETEKTADFIMNYFEGREE